MIKRNQRESRPSIFSPCSDPPPLPTSHMLSIEISKLINNYKRQLNLCESSANLQISSFGREKSVGTGGSGNAIGNNSLGQILEAGRNMYQSLYLAYEQNFVKMFSMDILKDSINAETILCNIVEGFKKISQFFTLQISKYQQFSELTLTTASPARTSTLQNQTKVHKKLFATETNKALCPQCNHILQQRVVESQMLHIQYSQFEDPFNLFTTGLTKFQEEVSALYDHDSEGWNESAIVENQKKVYAHLSKLKERINRRIGEIVEFVNEAEKYVDRSKEIEKKGTAGIKGNNFTATTFQSCYKTIIEIIEEKIMGLLKKFKKQRATGFKSIDVQAGEPLGQYHIMMALKQKLENEIQNKDNEIKKVRNLLEHAEKTLQNSIVELEKTKYHLKQLIQQHSKFKSQLEKEREDHKRTWHKLGQKQNQLEVMTDEMTQLRLQLSSQERDRGGLKKEKTSKKFLSKKKKITEATVRGSIQSANDRTSVQETTREKQQIQKQEEQKKQAQAYESIISHRTADKRKKATKIIQKEQEKKQTKGETTKFSQHVSLKDSQKEVKQASPKISRKGSQVKGGGAKKKIYKKESNSRKMTGQCDQSIAGEIQQQEVDRQSSEQHENDKKHYRNNSDESEVQHFQQYANKERHHAKRLNHSMKNSKGKTVGIQINQNERKIDRIIMEKELPEIPKSGKAYIGKQNSIPLEKLKRLTVPSKKQKAEDDVMPLNTTLNEKYLQSQATTMEGFGTINKIIKRRSVEPTNTLSNNFHQSKGQKSLKNIKFPIQISPQQFPVNEGQYPLTKHATIFQSKPRFSLLSSKNAPLNVLSSSGQPTESTFNQEDVMNLYLCQESAYLHEKSTSNRLCGQQHNTNTRILAPENIRFITHILTLLAHFHLNCLSLYEELKLLLLYPFDSVIMQNVYIKVQINLVGNKGIETEYGDIKIKQALLRIIALHKGCAKGKGRFGICEHLDKFLSKLSKLSSSRTNRQEKSVLDYLDRSKNREADNIYGKTENKQKQKTQQNTSYQNKEEISIIQSESRCENLNEVHI